jgi:hypothetical protein
MAKRKRDPLDDPVTELPHADDGMSVFDDQPEEGEGDDLFSEEGIVDDDLLDDDLGFDLENDFDPDSGFSNEDLGLCPHGCSDDEGCEEPGCMGGPEWEDPDFNYEGYGMRRPR